MHSSTQRPATSNTQRQQQQPQHSIESREEMQCGIVVALPSWCICELWIFILLGGLLPCLLLPSMPVDSLQCDVYFESCTRIILQLHLFFSAIHADLQNAHLGRGIQMRNVECCCCFFFTFSTLWSLSLSLYLYLAALSVCAVHIHTITSLVHSPVNHECIPLRPAEFVLYTRSHTTIVVEEGINKNEREVGEKASFTTGQPGIENYTPNTATKKERKKNIYTTIQPHLIFSQCSVWIAK